MKYIAIVLFVIITSCSSSKENSSETVPAKREVISKSVEEPQYRVVEVNDDSSMIDHYFTVVKGNDTSLLYVEYNQNYLGVRYHYEEYKPNYKKFPLNRIEQIALIVEYLAEQKIVNSLGGIYLRGLDDYGEYSIAVAGEYLEQFGPKSPAATGESYGKVALLVFNSDLTAAVNRAMEPLNYKVKKVSLEKIFLSQPRWELYRDYLPDTVQTPDTLLHAQTWMVLEKGK